MHAHTYDACACACVGVHPSARPALGLFSCLLVTELLLANWFYIFFWGGGLASSKQQASKGANWGPGFSFSGATVPVAPKLGGWVPLCETIKRGSIWAPKPPLAPVGGHYTASNGPIGPGD